MCRLIRNSTWVATALALLVASCANAQTATRTTGVATRAIARLMVSVGPPSVKIQIQHVRKGSALQSALMRRGILALTGDGSSCDLTYALTPKGRSLAQRDRWRSISWHGHVFAYEVSVGSFRGLRVLGVSQSGDSYAASFQYVLDLNQTGERLRSLAPASLLLLSQAFPKPDLPLSEAGRTQIASAYLFPGRSGWIAGYPKNQGFPRVMQPECPKPKKS